VELLVFVAGTVYSLRADSGQERGTPNTNACLGAFDGVTAQGHIRALCPCVLDERFGVR